MRSRRIYGVLLLLIAVVACRKKNKGVALVTPAVNRNIKKVQYHRTGRDSHYYHLTYNAENRIDSIIEALDTSYQYVSKKFSYTYTMSGFEIVDYFGITSDTNTIKVFTDTIGNAVKVIKGNSRSGDTFLYNYNGTELISEQLILNGSAPGPVYSKTWTNGDINGYLYDTVKWQLGDYATIQDFLNNGYATVKTRHLSIGSSMQSTQQWFYKFDSYGRIVEVSLPTKVDTILYLYSY